MPLKTDTRSKAEAIRIHKRVGGFSNREIAVLVGTTLAYVKTSGTRSRKPARTVSLERALSELRERLKASEIRADRQDAVIAKLLASVHNEGAADAGMEPSLLYRPRLTNASAAIAHSSH